MRFVGIDLGDKRTGIAVGDSVLRLASPVTVIEVPIAQADGAPLIAAIVKAVADQLGSPSSPGGVVMGLPLNMDNTEGPRAKFVRAFSDRLAAALRRPITFHDERLTSAAADWTMSQSGLTHGQKKARRDAIAAAAMLQGFLDARFSPPGDAP